MIKSVKEIAATVLGVLIMTGSVATASAAEQAKVADSKAATQEVTLHTGDSVDNKLEGKATKVDKAGKDGHGNDPYFIGNEYVRYDNLTKNGVLTNKIKYNTEYGIAQQISPNAYIQIQGRNETKIQSGEKTVLNTWGKSFLKLTYTKATFEIGRVGYSPAYGLIINSELNGGRLTLNPTKDFMISAWGGIERYDGCIDSYNGTKALLSSDVGGKANNEIRVYGMDALYKVNKKLDFKGLVMQAELDNGAGETNYWEIGTEYKLSKDLVLRLSKGGSDAGEFNDAHAVALTYGKCNTKKPGTWDIRYAISRVERFSALDSAYFRSTGYSGSDIRMNYCYDKNASVQVEYANRSNTQNASDKMEGYHVNLRFAF